MQLVTNALLKKMPALYATEKETNPRALVKFFAPCGRAAWYAFEAEKQADGDVVFFGYVLGATPLDDELGYFNLSDLEAVRLPFGLKVERDRYFDGATLDEIKKAVR